MKAILRLIIPLLAFAGLQLQAQPSSNVTRLVAGTNITLTPPSGVGSVRVSSTSVATSPGGSTTQVQFNNAGAFGGSANLSFLDGTTTGQLLVPVGAVATPSLTFLGDTDTGLYHIGANSLGLATGATLALTLDSAQAATFSQATSKLVAKEYSSDGYYRLAFLATATTATAANSAISGNGTNLYLNALAGGSFFIQTNGGTQALAIDSAQNATFAGNIVMTNPKTFAFGTSLTIMSAPADGRLLLTSSAANDFGRIQLGGTTSSFPAIKRSSGTIQIRLADDSGMASLSSNNITVEDGNASTPSVTFTNDSDNGMYRITTNTIGVATGGALSFQLSGGATPTWVGGAGNLIIKSGTGASRTLTFKTTTSGSTAATTLTLNADQTATFAGAVSGTSMTLTGNLTTGSGGSTAGGLALTQGTAGSPAANTWLFQAPTSVTAYTTVVPGATGTGFWLGTNSSGTETITRVASNGSGNVLLASGTIAITSGKTVTFDHTSTFTTTDSQAYTFPTTSATLARTDAANTFTGASATTSWTANTQTAGTANTTLSTTLYADTAARGTSLGTFASPNTAAGSITWVSPVYNIYTSASGATRTYTLPAASSYNGQAFILNVVAGTNHVNLQPASGAALVLAGVLLTADHYVQAATSAAGNYIAFTSDGTNWTSLGSSGTWADAASP